MKQIRTILFFLLIISCTFICVSTASAYSENEWSERILHDEEYIDLHMEDPAPRRGILKSMPAIDDTYKSEKEFIAEQLIKLYLVDGKSGDREKDLVFVRYYTEDEKASDEVHKWAQKLYFNTLYDYPDLTYFVKTSVETNYITTKFFDEDTEAHYYLIAFYPQTIIPDDVITAPDRAAYDKEYEDAVNAACMECFGASTLEGIQEIGMTDLEKVVAAHDWIVANCIYDPYVEFGKTDGGFGPDPTVYTSYGVFVNEKAVCQGYALALKVLLDRADVDCYFVDSAPLNHAWDVVYVGGAWYHIDVTWDDPGTQFSTADGSVRRKNFLLCNEGVILTGHLPNGWDVGEKGVPWTTEFTIPIAEENKSIPVCLDTSQAPMYLYDKQLYLPSGKSLYVFTPGEDFTGSKVVNGLDIADTVVASALDRSAGKLYLISAPVNHWFTEEIKVGINGWGTQMVYQVPLASQVQDAVRISAIDNDTIYITKAEKDESGVSYSYNMYLYGVGVENGLIYTTSDYNKINLRTETHLDGDSDFRLYYPSDLDINSFNGARFDIYINDGVAVQICMAYFAESGQMLGLDLLPIDARGICILGKDFSLPAGTDHVKLFSTEITETGAPIPLAERIRIGN